MLPGAPAVLAQHSSANGAAPGPFAGAEVPLLHEPSDNSAESRNAASPVIGNGEPSYQRRLRGECGRRQRKPEREDMRDTAHRSFLVILRGWITRGDLISTVLGLASTIRPLIEL